MNKFNWFGINKLNKLKKLNLTDLRLTIWRSWRGNNYNLNHGEWKILTFGYKKPLHSNTSRISSCVFFLLINYKVNQNFILFYQIDSDSTKWLLVLMDIYG